MNILEFQVNGQNLTRVDSQEVVNKNHNIYKCRFTFEENSEWDDANKFVIFTDGWGNSSTQHLGKSSNILSCMVPDKMLKGSYFKISVYAKNLVTTNNISVSLIQSGYKNHHPHHHHHGSYYGSCNHSYGSYWGKGHECEEDIFVEIFDRLDKSIDSLVYDNHTLHLFNRDDLVESIYLPFVSEEDINSLLEDYVSDYLEENSLLSLDDKRKLDSIEENANYIIVDSELDSESSNPVENRVVTSELNNLGDRMDIMDITIQSKEDVYDIVERIDNVIVDLINNSNE